jgi:GGDEF domain-containing protein
VARVVRAHVRQTDSLARLGGDEFLIVASETAAGRRCGWPRNSVRR